MKRLGRGRGLPVVIAIAAAWVAACADETEPKPTGSGGGGGGVGGGNGGGGAAGQGGQGGQGGAGGAPEQPVVVAEGRVNLQAIRVQGETLVWTEFGGGNRNNGGVFRCDLDGCGAQPMPVAVMQPWPSSLVLDESTIYWTDRTSDDTFSCGLADTCPAPTPIVSGSSIQWDIAVDASSIFFTLGADEQGLVARCPLTGCQASQAETFAADQNRPNHIIASNGTVFWSTLGTPPEFTDSKLLACASTGCDAAPVEIAAEQTLIWAIDADESRVYWSVGADTTGAILACTRTGCTAGEPTVLVTGATVGHMEVDASGVYWTDLGTGPSFQDGRVLFCPLSGCGDAPTVLATDQGGPRGIATSATHVFWVNGFDGRVMKVKKP